MAPESTLKDVVVFVNNPGLLDAARSVCKELGASNVVCPVNAEECLRGLNDNLAAPLIIDFSVGAAEVHRILSAVQTEHRVAIRPIFLFSTEEVKGLDGLAMEFSVYQIHVGELSKNTLKERLQELTKAQFIKPEVSECLTTVLDARIQGEWEAGEALLSNAIQSHGADSRLLSELAESYVHRNEPEKVVELLAEHAQSEHSDVRILNIYGRALAKLGKFDEATVALQKAKIINPFNYERLIELGDAYLCVDMPKRARSNYEEALKQDSRNTKATQGMGKSLLMEGDINAALPFLKSLSGPEEAASVFNTAAVLCMRNARHDDGFNLYRVAIRALGNNPPVLAKICFNLGIGYHRINDLEPAKNSFALACKIDPTYDKARKNLSHLEKATGPAEHIDLGDDLVKSVLGFTDLAVARGAGDAVQDDLFDEDYDLTFE